MDQYLELTFLGGKLLESVLQCMSATRDMIAGSYVPVILDVYKTLAVQ